MGKSASKHKRSFSQWLESFSGESIKLRAEKARLEAFLAAVPGEYCGFSSDRSIAYSKGFCDLLNLVEIRSLADIQNRLAPGDAAALESLFDRIQNKMAPFTMVAKSHDGKKSYKLSGSCGHDLSIQDHFFILWIEDITQEVEAQEKHSANTDEDKERLKRLEESLNNIHRPIWIRDDTQKIIWVNNSYIESAGIPLGEIIETQKELASPTRKKKNSNPDELTPGVELAKKALEADQIYSTKAHVIVKGDRLLMDISEIPMTEMKTTLGMALNITREEDLETELRRHQTSNKELLEQLGTAISIYDADKKLEFYNPAFAQLWSLEDGWLNTHPKLGDIMEKLRETRRLPEQADFRSFKQSWIDMFTSLIDPFEDMLYLPDGSTVRMSAIPHSMGGLMMTFEDVTSRLELESSYNTLIAVQQETLDNLGEGVAVYGGDGRLKLCNPAFSRLWDLNPEDIEGEPHITAIVQKFEKFFTKEEWETRKEELVAKALDRLLHEGRHERADKTLLDFSTVPLPDGGVLITYSDVTDTVRVENALREKNTALETAEKLKLDFLANVSYQLRTPLNAIMGFNEILDQEYFGPLNQRQKEYTHDMKLASDKLLTLINDILDLSTIEAGQMKLDKADINITTLLSGTAELVSEWARKQNLEISIECPKNIGKVSCDKGRIKQALLNLIRNSINFTNDGGKIILKASRKKDHIMLSVSDTGVGISKEDQARIFEPFERATTHENESTEDARGAGLGLSLVKNIAELHGGYLEIESAEGKGTTIAIFLPSKKQENQ